MRHFRTYTKSSLPKFFTRTTRSNYRSISIEYNRASYSSGLLEAGRVRTGFHALPPASIDRGRGSVVRGD
jgi:hypothetical protein